MPNKNKDNSPDVEQALENMEVWSHGIDLMDSPRGWFSNNWVMSGPATNHTEVGSHHITWQNPPQNTRGTPKKPDEPKLPNAD